MIRVAAHGHSERLWRALERLAWILNDGSMITDEIMVADADWAVGSKLAHAAANLAHSLWGSSPCSLRWHLLPDPS